MSGLERRMREIGYLNPTRLVQNLLDPKDRMAVRAGPGHRGGPGRLRRAQRLSLRSTACGSNSEGAPPARRTIGSAQ
ncbi:hypothetical protein [Streptosporangium saharense]|uniref:hypothetical protein n=1 Tax=Streptosporangium saharense TaxID=1706840 RepID=UPI003318FC8C